MVVMVVEELDLMPKTTTSSLMEGDASGFRKKFNFVANILLEAPEED